MMKGGNNILKNEKISINYSEERFQAIKNEYNKAFNKYKQLCVVQDAAADTDVFVFDFDGVLAAATDNFWYDHEESFLASRTTQSIKDGTFLADDPIKDKRLYKIIMDKYG